jgi:hypothetical protein
MMSFSRYSRKQKHSWSTPQDCKSGMAHAILVVDSPRVYSFMGDVDRLVARDYEPSDQDVIKARLRTVGVQEYHFSIPGGKCSIFYASAAPCLTHCQPPGATTGSCTMSAARGHP